MFIKSAPRKRGQDELEPLGRPSNFSKVPRISTISSGGVAVAEALVEVVFNVPARCSAAKSVNRFSTLTDGAALNQSAITLAAMATMSPTKIAVRYRSFIVCLF